MRMKPFRRAGAVVASAAMVLGGTALASAAQPSWHHPSGIQHVLLISVDGMHQSDLEWYVARTPQWSLGRMLRIYPAHLSLP